MLVRSFDCLMWGFWMTCYNVLVPQYRTLRTSSGCRKHAHISTVVRAASHREWRCECGPCAATMATVRNSSADSKQARLEPALRTLEASTSTLVWKLELPIR